MQKLSQIPTPKAHLRRPFLVSLVVVSVPEHALGMALGGGALRLPQLANVVRAEVGRRLDQLTAPLVALPHGVDGAQRDEDDGRHADEPAEGLDVAWVRVVAPVGGHEVVNRHEEDHLQRRERFEKG